MGQGMCAGIRDVSNLAWKLALSCKNGHNEKLLDSYQTERSPNVRDYINTTMKMGELLNAIGSTNVSDTIFMQSDGTIKMETIKPALGKGLGFNKDINRGKVFPSVMSKDGDSFDKFFDKETIIIADQNIIETIKDINIPKLSSIDFPELKRILDFFKSKALIIRPDRYILASLNNFDNKKYIEKVIECL
jgi:3-(3-hydroxy-phenyl)propionate hydroxylase